MTSQLKFNNNYRSNSNKSKLQKYDLYLKIKNLPTKLILSSFIERLFEKKILKNIY